MFIVANKYSKTKLQKFKKAIEDKMGSVSYEVDTLTVTLEMPGSLEDENRPFAETGDYDREEENA